MQQVLLETAPLADDGGALLVVGFQSQGFKELLIREDGRQFVSEPETFAMDRAEQFGKLFEKLLINFAI